jgi:hypothetical protein
MSSSCERVESSRQQEGGVRFYTFASVVEKEPEDPRRVKSRAADRGTTQTVVAGIRSQRGAIDWKIRYGSRWMTSLGHGRLKPADIHYVGLMDIEFNGTIWYWRGPAPWYFVTVPEEQCRDLKAMLEMVTYGWGMIPATIQIGKTEWETSLFPKDGRYIVPIKASVRKAESLEDGDKVTVRLVVQ